jgi:hypothetical protein
MGKDSWRSSQTYFALGIDESWYFIHINENGCFTHGKIVSPRIDLQGNMLCLVAVKT